MRSPTWRNGSTSIRSGASCAGAARCRTRGTRPMRADQRARRDAFLNLIGARPVVMGILNVTPDSFSDGGRFLAADAAVTHAKQMAAQGCAIVDIGGESRRPGATAVAESEELTRIGGVVAHLAETLPVPVSVDIYKASVAVRAVALGAI